MSDELSAECRDALACSCEICTRGREIERIAALLPDADAASLRRIHNRLLDDEESADWKIASMEDEIASMKVQLAAANDLRDQWERAAHEQAEKVAELLRGEFICKKCGIRKDGEGERGDF